MNKKEKLYDAFGELIYAMAMADGAVQKVEIEKLQQLLQNNTWANEIQWSFNYELSKAHSMEEAYAKAIDTCKEYGPSEEYIELLHLLKEIAKSSIGINANEEALINQLKTDLTNRFRSDLEKMKLLDR